MTFTPPTRYDVKCSALLDGAFVVFDHTNVKMRHYPNEWQAKQVVAWLNERDAGYPINKRLQP